MSKKEYVWVIQRDDGKFYAGWSFDSNCSVKEYFTFSLAKVILYKQVFYKTNAMKEIKQMSLKNCRPVPVKVKIQIVGEDDE